MVRSDWSAVQFTNCCAIWSGFPQNKTHTQVKTQTQNKTQIKTQTQVKTQTQTPPKPWC